MRALVLEEYGRPPVLREVARPEPGPQDVLVRVRANGLCATDLKMIAGHIRTITLPHIMGHEVAGEVVETGPEVTHLRPGDPVVVHVYIGCGLCVSCRTGRENLCPGVRRLGFELAGGFGEYLRVPARNAFRVAPSVPLEQASILSGSLATAYHGLKHKGRIQLGDTVVIVGVGGLGVHAVQLARALGGRVIAADVVDEKLEAARAYGADAVINSAREDLPTRVRELTGGEGAEVVTEFVAGSGLPAVLRQCLSCLRPGGRLVVAGYQYGHLLRVDTADLVYGQWELLGTRSSTKQDLVEVIRLVESGTVRPVVSTCYPIDEVATALDRLQRTPPLGRIVLIS
ncbi:MAG TPA: zinc-binding dehydrogenase [Chloroflexi bacterium]|nr:zinc-binding dehydrogenase [Chloroflexota bacterium]